MEHISSCLGNNPTMLRDNGGCDHSGTQCSDSLLCNDLTMMNPEQQPAGRARLYSDSHLCSQLGRWEEAEFQDVCGGLPGDGRGSGAPFRGRSHSAPAALWAAKTYGRQLRRMSDEFDSWLDRGEQKRGSSPGPIPPQQATRGWFSFLWSLKEEEGRQ